MAGKSASCWEENAACIYSHRLGVLTHYQATNFRLLQTEIS